MGLVCPVCESPESDAVHLAHHMAMTAILGDAEHERFLDERVPKWEECSPDRLGSTIADLAEETDDEVTSEPVEHAHPSRPSTTGPAAPPRSDTLDDPEIQAVLERARAYTEQMYDRQEDDSDGSENE